MYLYFFINDTGTPESYQTCPTRSHPDALPIETDLRLDHRAHRGTSFTPSGNRPMTNDLKTWKRNTAVRRFNEIKAEANLNGIPMPDAAAAEKAAFHSNRKSTRLNSSH